MTLLDYLKGLDAAQLEAFAACCGTSAGQLKQIAYGNRRSNAGLAIAIDRQTTGRVTCESLRPDIDWEYLRMQGHTSVVADASAQAA
ncbi:helix-turn-helix domain-containing protein [Pseudomonas marginalis]|uniref:Helix-turn-helix domain-containing protein n=1 Tax=Pseudomonas marginalis TaxID=298 RepID=A0A9X9BU41_PSEMA|nr:YdaS family helix-turn-helix protein [Pseudomonas marginalis]TWR59765.1 helix-turn-helix domain-containing protein [Pseudomonas marginalis]SED27026.1 Putative antitoxin of toxin-antitoxin system, YdaS/YdaT [Pseudomonas marginalis]